MIGYNSDMRSFAPKSFLTAPGWNWGPLYVKIAQEVEDGTVHIIDMRGEHAVTVELYPDRKKAVVTEIIGLGPRHDPDLIEMVRLFEQKPTDKLGTKKADGKTLQGF